MCVGGGGGGGEGGRGEGGREDKSCTGVCTSCLSHSELLDDLGVGERGDVEPVDDLSAEAVNSRHPHPHTLLVALGCTHTHKHTHTHSKTTDAIFIAVYRKLTLHMHIKYVYAANLNGMSQLS